MKILLVEDSDAMRGVVREMLRRLDYGEVVEASDGEEAWFQLCQEPFDLLLTDWNMPNMSGLELVEMVRQKPEFSDLPVVMLTTRNNKQDIVSAIKAGIDNYITKPCKPSQLKSKIDKAMRHAAQRRSKSKS
jgi:two-component system chemotaxis response regulator CheY